MQMTPEELKKTLPAWKGIEVDQHVRNGLGCAVYINQMGVQKQLTSFGGRGPDVDFAGDPPSPWSDPEDFETLYLENHAYPPGPEDFTPPAPGPMGKGPVIDRFHDAYSAQNSQINTPPRPPVRTEYPRERW